METTSTSTPHQSHNGPALTDEDLGRLSQHESAIQSAREDFLEIGRHLRSIRDSKLYTVYAPTFKEYVDIKWGWTPAYAYFYLWALDVVEDLENAQQDYTRVYVPHVKSHAYRLHKLNREQRIAVAQELFQLHHDGLTITNKVVERTVRQAIKQVSKGEPTELNCGAIGDNTFDTARDQSAEPNDVDDLSGAAGGGDEIESLSAIPPGFYALVGEDAGRDFDGGIETDGGYVLPWPTELERNPAFAKAVHDNGRSDGGAMNPSTSSELPGAWTWSPIEFHPSAGGWLATGRGSLETAVLMSNRDQQPMHTSLNDESDRTSSRRDRFVIVCPDGDLFDPIVPTIVIEAVLAKMREACEWMFVVLTNCVTRAAALSQKMPLAENVLIGASAADSSKVADAETALGKITGGVKWIYVRDVNGPVSIADRSCVRWLVLDSLGRDIPFKFVSSILDDPEPDFAIYCCTPVHRQPQLWPRAPKVSASPPPKNGSKTTRDRDSVAHSEANRRQNLSTVSRA